jgi:phosphoglycolate phosphatase-like HAD superfamily hydrolase
LNTTRTGVHPIVLFDIDKTLVARSGAHLKAFFAALREVYGVDTHPNVITYHGMTDQQIIREVLKTKGLDEQKIDAGLRQCTTVMIQRFSELISSDTVELLPGVVALLDALAKRESFLGLVTGNLEPIAWGKLGKAGVAGYFSFGGFGSDHIDRREMAALAIRRCNEKHPLSLQSSVTLFGDTPYDIGAGKHIGAKAIGVRTGYPTRDQLIAAGADFVFNDLADTQAVLDVIFSR